MKHPHVQSVPSCGSGRILFEQHMDDRVRDATHSLRGTVLTPVHPETYEYRLGNRSALEWIVDQYQVSTDKRSGITNDPNREDDKEYILRFIGQVIYVSLETVKIVKGLPTLAPQK